MDQRKLQEFLIFNRYTPDLYALPTMPINDGITPGLNPNSLYQFYTNLHEDPQGQFLAEAKQIPKDQIGRGKNERPTSPITIQNLFEKLNHPAYRITKNSPISEDQSQKPQVNTTDTAQNDISSEVSVKESNLGPLTSTSHLSLDQPSTSSQGKSDENLPLSEIKLKNKRPWHNQEDKAKFKFY